MGREACLRLRLWFGRRLDVGVVWRGSRLHLGIERPRRSQRLVNSDMLIGFVGRQPVVVRECRHRLVLLFVLVEGLPLRRLSGRDCVRLERAFRGKCIVPADLGTAPDRTERLAFSTLDFGWVGATPTLEVEVLANRVV